MAKIVTIHIPETWIEAIKRLVGEDKLYPSRSELVRKAVSKKLKTYIEEAKTNMRPKPKLIPKPKESETEHLKRLVRETLEEKHERELQNL